MIETERKQSLSSSSSVSGFSPSVGKIRSVISLFCISFCLIFLPSSWNAPELVHPPPLYPSSLFHLSSPPLPLPPSSYASSMAPTA